MKRITLCFVLIMSMFGISANAASITVKVKNSAGWNEINIYAWQEGFPDTDFCGAWPGRPAVKQGDWYTLTFDSPSASVKVIANNNSSNQTDSFETSGEICIEVLGLGNPARANVLDCTTGSIISETGNGSAQGGGTQGGEVFQVKKPDTWATINAYAYLNNNPVGAGWPGNAMTDNGNGWYCTTFPAGAHVIFNNGGNGEQTDEVTASGCYEVNMNQSTIDGNNQKVYAILVSNNCPSSSCSGSTTPTTNGITVQVKIPAGWNDIKAYAYGDNGEISAGWPGNAMTDNGNGWYCTTFPAGAHVIFNNGGNGEQTDEVTASGCYEVNMNQSTIDGNNQKVYAILVSNGCPSSSCSGSTTPTTDGITVQVKIPAGWNDIKAYAYGDNGEISAGWPGNAMTDNGNGWYCTTFPAGAHVIFNNGGNGEQTDEVTASGCYEVNMNQSTIDGNNQKVYAILVSNGCPSSDCGTNSSIQDIYAASISMYPNPVEDEINISADSKIGTITIYNIAGQKVAAEVVNARSATLNVSNLNAGMYIVHIEKADGNKAVNNIIKK